MCLLFGSNLWYFVSKFTEYDAKKLFRLYRRAVKKQQGIDDSSPDRKSKDNSSKDKKKDKKIKEEVGYLSTPVFDCILNLLFFLFLLGSEPII